MAKRKVTPKRTVQQPINPSTILDGISLSIADAFTSHPLSFAKGLGALALVAYMGINPFSIAGVYGMYRYTNEQWFATAKSWLNSVYHFSTDLFSKVKNNHHTQNVFQRLYNFTADFFTQKPAESHSAYYLKILIAVSLATAFAAGIVLNSVSTLISLALRTLQFAFVATGFSAIYQDIKTATGNQDNVFGSIGSAIKNGFNKCVAGVRSLWSTRPQDNFVANAIKWGASFVVAATPVILISDGGLELIAIAGGLGATGLIAGGLTLAVGGAIATAMAISKGSEMLTANKESKRGEPQAALQIAPVQAITHKESADAANKPAAKAITPGFQKEKEKATQAKKPQTRSKAKPVTPEKDDASPSKPKRGSSAKH